MAAIAGFAFVAAWIGFSFGEALLCLLGAAVGWTAIAIIEGKINLADLQARLQNEDDAPPAPATTLSQPPPPPSAAPAPRPVRAAGRPRVQ